MLMFSFFVPIFFGSFNFQSCQVFLDPLDEKIVEHHIPQQTCKYDVCDVSFGVLNPPNHAGSLPHAYYMQTSTRADHPEYFLEQNT